VSSAEPFEKLGMYWGYQVRVAHSFKEIFEGSNYEEGYDLKIGDHCNNQFEQAEQIDFVDFSKHKGFKHALVFFGGLQGIKGVLEGMDNEVLNASNLQK